jgi:AcrR family transcriptional regulator
LQREELNNVPKNTRENILNAFLNLAMENPKKTNFTMREIAKRTHVSRQAIYQKHFKNPREIVLYLRQLIGADLRQAYEAYHSTQQSMNPFILVANTIIPVFYKKRKLVRCFYVTSIDPTWESFVADTYLEWALPRLTTRSEAFNLSDEDLLKILIHSVMAIIRIWISDEHPTAPELFKDDFFKLIQTPLFDYLLPESDDWPEALCRAAGPKPAARGQ